jgi:hypothetical protein
VSSPSKAVICRARRADDAGRQARGAGEAADAAHRARARRCAHEIRARDCSMPMSHVCSCNLLDLLGAESTSASPDERELQMTPDSVQDRSTVRAERATADGCETRQRFTCALCGKLVPWSDGGADDRPMDCSECWCKWWQDLKKPPPSTPSKKKPPPSTPSKKKPPTKTEIARDLGEKINVHLQRFQRDPKINPGKRYDKTTKTWVSDARGVRDYYGAQAFGDRHRVRVVYVSYQGASILSIEDAQKYLLWLDAGNVGMHHEVLR